MVNEILKTPLNGRYNLIDFFVFVFSIFWRYSIKFDSGHEYYGIKVELRYTVLYGI